MKMLLPQDLSTANGMKQQTESKEQDTIAFLQNLQERVGADKFCKAVEKVQSHSTRSGPRFPENIVVSKIPSTTDESLQCGNKVEELFHDNEWQQGSQQIRDAQFRRWGWCCENIDTYVNMLRKSGHSDESISQMIHAGKPLGIPSDTLFREFKRSLQKLKTRLQKDTGWVEVSFALSGSSVCGFSQNSLARDGDVLTLCIRASGVHLLMSELQQCDSNVVLAAPATCTPFVGGLRYYFLQEGGLSLVSSYLLSWYNQWSKTLPGLGLSFSEDSLEIPPWEVPVDELLPLRKREPSNVTDDDDDDDDDDDIPLPTTHSSKRQRV
mmetsp:Transcript_23716/g.36004  ORF Transcript_23716/g.36004 Transcript_23716/m.36004 type:complete len:324 (+) Transcript_23716:102-1073(+)|eukprot:CAMPEP_0178929312 /NCGR_PEP_ID=MMETSP0786-20121207/20499_1 /TAXON_ID=186022 /ORGANISM="Thalassionema frauenfeldii, Strain CCMP 1798" /LENGTH=323 /DNA_ID=CAMNT_0020605493 /DNA_START=83 /DNA_END=1054 /DNA_ORIENTATION=+